MSVPMTVDNKMMHGRKDGVWSIVVGVAAFLAQVILGGLVYTSGIYYTHFVDVFRHDSPLLLSWLCSMTFVGWLLGSTGLKRGILRSLASSHPKQKVPCDSDYDLKTSVRYNGGSGGIMTTAFYRSRLAHVFPNGPRLGTSLLGGSLGSMVLNKCGYRLCALLGGTVSGTGLCLCIFSTDIYLLFLFYGIFASFGTGVYYIGFITAVNDHFDKYRSTVQVLMGVGSTVGMAVFSVLLPYLIDEYGWRGCMLLQGGVTLNVCALAVVLVPSKMGSISSKKHRLLKCCILFKWRYFLFCLNSLVVSLMSTVIFVYLPSLVLMKEFPQGTTSLALSICAVCNAVGSLVYSFPVKFDTLVIYTISIAVGGVMALSLPVFKTLTGLLICTGLMGFSFTVISGVSVLVISNLVPSKDFPDAIGINFVFRAVGAVISGPLAGFLYDISLEYSTSFYVAGSCLIVSSSFLLPVIWTRSCGKSRDFTSGENNVIYEETVSLKPP